MPQTNVSRRRKADPLPGIRTTDAPGPLESFWGTRAKGEHAIPADKLTVRKSLKIFDQMSAVDETVNYAHNVKRRVRLSTGLTIEEPKDDDDNPLPGSEVIADHIREQVEKWDRWEQFLYQLLDGTRQGFKLGEIVTEQGRIGGKQAWTLQDVLVRNSRFYAFETDRAGRPTAVKEWIGPSPDGGGMSTYWPEGQFVKRHPIEKFVRFTWEPEDSNAYSLFGKSDFRAIYRLYFLKDIMLKRWGETLDVYVHPIVIALTAQGLSETQRQDYLDNIVNAMKKRALVIPGEYVPPDMDPEQALRLHEVIGKASDFDDIIAMCDKNMMRGLFLGSLVADTGKRGGGSLALGQAHMRIFLRMMDWLGTSMGADLRCTLFKQIVRWNFGEQAVALTPTLKFQSAGDDDAEVRAKIITALQGAGVLDPTEPWIRKYVGVDEPPEEVIELREKQRENQMKVEAEGPTYPTGHPNAPKPEPGGGPPGKASGLAATDEDDERARELIESKVDVGSVVARAEDRQAKHGRTLSGAWREVFQGKGGLAAQARFALSNPRRNRELEIPDGPLRAPWWSLYVESLVEGAVDAFGEVNRGQGRMGAQALSSVRMLKISKEAEPPVEDRTVDLASFAARHGVDLDERTREVAEKIQLREADLDVFADLRLAEIRTAVHAQVAKLRVQMGEAITRAKAAGVKPSAFVRSEEYRAIERKWSGLQGQLGNENSALWDTAENSVYNEGRYRMYEASPRSVVIGMLYSSVLDQNTTAFCLAWDGYMAPVDDPTLKRIVPPNHWRCRGMLVAVLAGERTVEQLKIAAARRPSIQPAQGFAGMKFLPPGVK